MDFENYNFRLTIKACCLYEQLSGKSFFECVTEEDILLLVYAIIVTCNPGLLMTFSVFQYMLTNKKFAKWVTTQYERVMSYIKQFKGPENEGEGKGQGGVKMTVTKIASALIVQHKVDASYVMNQMELWETTPFLQVAEDVKKSDLVEKRFWTFLQILPQIDGKKMKSPQSLIKFDWEKDDDNKAAKEDLERKQAYIKAFFAAQRKKKEEQQNGRQTDNDSGPAGTPEGV